jgi:predicted  nucleic acid-binding Zn-ribbon protein
MQKMEHLEADFTKKFAILEEQQKSNSDKDAMGKAEENIQNNQQKIEDLAWDIEDFEEKLEEAEQKAKMANNKVKPMVKVIDTSYNSSPF